MKRKVIITGIIALFALSLFVTPSSATIVKFDIKVDQVGVYKYRSYNYTTEEWEEPKYMKVKITSIADSDATTTEIRGDLWNFVADVDEFPETPFTPDSSLGNYTGDMDSDIINGNSIGIFLPLGEQIGDYTSEMEVYMRSIYEDIGYTVESSSSKSIADGYGYSLKLEVSISSLQISKEIKAYYSTTGVQLKYVEYQKINSSLSQIEAKTEKTIVADESNLSGADENPENPTGEDAGIPGYPIALLAFATFAAIALIFKKRH